jgi:hypothetical protein
MSLKARWFRQERNHPTPLLNMKADSHFFRAFLAGVGQDALCWQKPDGMTSSQAALP